MKVNPVVKNCVPTPTNKFENTSSKNISRPKDYFSAAPLDTRLLTESFLPKKDLNSLVQTNKTARKSFHNNFHWKEYLKPELRENIAPDQALELYKNPANWQDKYVPTNKLGMEFLQNKGRFFNTDIFNDAFVLTCIKEGMISILDALRLTRPFASKFSGIEKSNTIKKLIIDNKLTVQAALNLTRQQVEVLECEKILQFIEEGKLTLQETLNLARRQVKILENKIILQFIEDDKLTLQAAIRSNGLLVHNLSYVLSLILNRFLFLPQNLANIIAIITVYGASFCYMFSLFTSLSFFFTFIVYMDIFIILLAIGKIIYAINIPIVEEFPILKTTPLTIQKYMNEGKLSLETVLNTEPGRLKNLNFTAIQNCISLGKITVEDALNLSSFRARFFNFFKNIPTGCYIDFKMNQSESEVTNEILRTKCRDRYFVCKNDTTDDLVLLKVDGQGRVESYSGDRESNFQINIKAFIVIHNINIDSRFRISREQFERLITKRGGPILD